MEPVILKGQRVTREEGPAVRRSRAIARGEHSEVRALSQDGVLRAIEVRCTCGDVITIELDGSGNGPAPAREGGE